MNRPWIAIFNQPTRLWAVKRAGDTSIDAFARDRNDFFRVQASDRYQAEEIARERRRISLGLTRIQRQLLDNLKAELECGPEECERWAIEIEDSEMRAAKRLAEAGLIRISDDPRGRDVWLQPEAFNACLDSSERRQAIAAEIRMEKRTAKPDGATGKRRAPGRL